MQANAMLYGAKAVQTAVDIWDQTFTKTQTTISYML